MIDVLDVGMECPGYYVQTLKILALCKTLDIICLDTLSNVFEKKRFKLVLTTRVNNRAIFNSHAEAICRIR
jgi:hypothetical protein